MTLDLLEIAPQAANDGNESAPVEPRACGLQASKTGLQPEPKGAQRSETSEKLTRKAKRKIAADSRHGQDISS
jgi:hypothetical protein